MKKLTRKQKIANIKKAFIERNSGKGYQHFFKDNTQGDFNEAPSNTQYHDYAIVSYLDDNAVDAGGNLVKENNRITVGAYHPLTKHLNLVAEFSQVESKSNGPESSLETDIMSVGAILFF